MDDIKVTYGVWIPSKGWVRGANNKAFADYSKAVALELANRIGANAKVYYVDEALVDLEEKLLDAERLRHSQNIFRRLGIIK